jgi:hypothetical protein
VEDERSFEPRCTNWSIQLGNANVTLAFSVSYLAYFFEMEIRVGSLIDFKLCAGKSYPVRCDPVQKVLCKACCSSIG